MCNFSAYTLPNRYLHCHMLRLYNDFLVTKWYKCCHLLQLNTLFFILWDLHTFMILLGDTYSWTLQTDALFLLHRNFQKLLFLSLDDPVRLFTVREVLPQCRWACNAYEDARQVICGVSFIASIHQKSSPKTLYWIEALKAEASTK